MLHINEAGVSSRAETNFNETEVIGKGKRGCGHAGWGLGLLISGKEYRVLFTFGKGTGSFIIDLLSLIWLGNFQARWRLLVFAFPYSLKILLHFFILVPPRKFHRKWARASRASKA